MAISKVSRNKRPDRRKDILSAAGKVFGTDGYAKATMDQVAALAGISKGSVYNYFRSKQDLFTQLFLGSVAEDETRTDELVRQTMGAHQKLDQLLDMWFERFSHYQKVGRLVLEFWMTAAGEDPQQGPFAKAYQGLYQRCQQRIAEILRQGIDSGELTLEYGPEIAAALILAIVDGIGLQVQLGVQRELNDKYLAALKRGIFNALSGRPERQQQANNGKK